MKKLLFLTRFICAMVLISTPSFAQKVNQSDIKDLKKEAKTFPNSSGQLENQEFTTSTNTVNLSNDKSSGCFATMESADKSPQSVIYSVRDEIQQKLKSNSKVTLDLFVMSKCPFGVMAEETLLPLVKEFGHQVDFRLNFIASEELVGGQKVFNSMHGQEEIDENIRQLVVARDYPEKLIAYLTARAKNYTDNNWQLAASEAGIDMQILDLAAKSAESQELFRTNINLAQTAGINASPTLLINGEQYRNQIITTALPTACQIGTDPFTGSAYVVCSASPTGAWISANNSGTYHATYICQSLGYNAVGSYGGTCGSVCGYCTGGTSCSSPQASTTFDGSGNGGTDANGLILRFTVQWQCVGVLCTPPTINCPANINMGNTTGQCGANVTYPAATTTGTTPTVTYSIPSGSFFPIGTTTVTATATNSCGTQSCTFTVTVNDTQVPSLAVVPTSPYVYDNFGRKSTLSSINLAGTGTNVAVVAPNAPVSLTFNRNTILTGACPGCITQHYVGIAGVWASQCLFSTTSPSSGSHSFSFTAPSTPGVYYITIRGSWEFSCIPVTMPSGPNDALAVVIVGSGSSCPQNVVVNATPGQCGAVVLSPTPSIIDNCPGGTVVQTTGLPSGSLYPVGTTVNTFVATDASGNTSTCSYTVTVNDTQAPTIACPANITVNNTPGQCGAKVCYTTPVITENCRPATPTGYTYKASYGNSYYYQSNALMNYATAQSSAIAAGGHLAVITSAAENSALNASGAGFGWIGGNDLVANGVWEYITCESSSYTNWCGGEPNGGNFENHLEFETGGCWNDLVNTAFRYSIIEIEGAKLTQTNGLAQNAFFPVGTTTNTFVATDASGNTGTCSFTVTVNDTQPPVITCPTNIVVNNTPGQCGANVTFAATATDNCGTANLSYSPVSGSFFGKGTTTVTVTANDGHGNTASCTFTVTVNDTQAPSITCAPAVVINNTPGLCTGTTILSIPTVNDNCATAGNALSLDGSNDHVVLPEFNLGTSNFTIETWIKPNTASNGYIISNRTFEGNQPGNWFVLSRQASGIIAFEMAADNSPPYFAMNNNTAVPIGVWSHIAVVRSGTSVTIYINGVADNTQSDTVVRNISTGNYSLMGGFPAYNAAWFNGALNEVRIWTVARTASQIQLNRDTELNAQVGLRALYHFNQGVANGNNAGINNLIDSSGNNLNGTLNNFALNGAASNWVAENPLSNVVITNNAPLAFTLGANTVTWTATDPSGNSSSCTQSVTVNDSELPLIACPGNIDVDMDPGQCGANVSFAATASDNCGTANITYSPASGSFFGIGTTTVTATADDGHGNTASCTFTVTVDLLDHVNLQWPPNATICPGGSFTAYGQVYEPNVTTVSGSQGANIEVQFGYSTTDTNPSLWTNWSSTLFNQYGGGSNNDEYYYNFSSNTPGTYYYTFRYRQNGCTWQYGGFQQWDGGTWDGTNYVSGVLTVQSLDWANLQWPPSATICQGSALTAYGQVYETGVTPGAGQGAGIEVQFGYNSSNTNPSGWSNWATASFNQFGGGPANDEYYYNFTPPTSGTYYYTFRYRLNGCLWQYGGYSPPGGYFWDGTNFINGTLTVDPTTVAGTVSGGTSICPGETSALLTLSGYTGTILGWESATAPFSTWNPIANSNNTYTSGPLSETTKFRAIVQSGVCTSLPSGETTVIVYFTYPFYADNDGDSYGAGPIVMLCSDAATNAPNGYSIDGTDCDDTKDDRHQTFPFYVDGDGDGYGREGSTAVQLCAVDGNTPPQPNYSVNDDDCNDGVFAIHPGVYDIPYDSIDNNCDGSLFDGHAPIVVYVLSPSCGGINHGLNNTINCTEIYLGEGFVIGYRFKVTNLATGEVDYVDTTQHHFKLTDTDIYSYGTAYSIQVAAIVNGEVQPYNGPICTLTTTNVATTKVVTNQCGSTLLFMGSTINANAVNSAISYRFRVARADAPNTYYYSGERNLPNFNLTMLTVPVGFLTYATEYKVAVQIKIKLANIIAWSQFGQVCSIFTPTPPTSSVIASQCELIATSNTQVINATPFAGATVYRFMLTHYDGLGNIDYQQYQDSPTPSFTLSMFTGLQPATAYNVAVSMQLYGTFVPYDKECSVTTPAFAKEVVAIPFKATVYPNPYTENFMIDVKTTNTSVIEIKVYDMIGRLVEQKVVKVNDLTGTSIGERYPSGVYNVTVSQGEEVITLRVVKR